MRAWSHGVGAMVLIFSMMAPGELFASCAGVEGCDPCYDIQSPPGKDFLQCSQKQDCVVIEDGCGRWLAVAKEKAGEVYVRQQRKSTGEPPLALCKEEQCVLAPPSK